MSLDEFKQLKRENRELQGQITEILDQITPDDELLKENRNLSDALNGMMHDNMLYKNSYGRDERITPKHADRTEKT